jgi:hypothetical protein
MLGFVRHTIVTAFEIFIIAPLLITLGNCQADTTTYAQNINGVYYVPANSSDFGAAINATLAQCPVNSSGYVQCEIHLPYSNGGKWATTVTITSPGVSLIGHGSYASVFKCTVAGDCLRIYTSPFTVQQAGRYQGFGLYGTPAANGCGIHMGEIEAAHFEDLDIANFTGANGCALWLDNAHANGSTGTWTERDTFVGIRLANSPILLKFSVEKGNSSFAYNRFLDLRMNLDGAAGYTGIDIGAGAGLYNSTLRTTVNAGSAANIMKIEAASGSLGAGFFQGELHLFGEGTPGHLFNAAVGSGLNLTSDSSVSWVGPIPSSSVNGTATWLYGASQNPGSGIIPGNISVPIQIYRPTVKGGAVFTGASWSLALFLPSVDDSSKVEVYGANAKNSVVNWSITQGGGFAASSLSIGNGGAASCSGALCLSNSSTPLSRYAKYTATLSPSAVAANTCAAQSVTVTGVQANDIVIKAQKPTEQTGLALIGGRVTAANTVALDYCNVTSASITPTADEAYTFVVMQ